MEKLAIKLYDFATEHKTVFGIMMIAVFGLAYGCDMLLADYMGLTSSYGMPIQ